MTEVDPVEPGAEPAGDPPGDEQGAPDIADLQGKLAAANKSDQKRRGKITEQKATITEMSTRLAELEAKAIEGDEVATAQANAKADADKRVATAEKRADTKIIDAALTTELAARRVNDKAALAMAIRAIDRSDLTIDADTGEVSGISAAADAFLEAFPQSRTGPAGHDGPAGKAKTSAIDFTDLASVKGATDAEIDVHLEENRVVITGTDPQTGADPMLMSFGGGGNDHATRIRRAASEKAQFLKDRGL